MLRRFLALLALLLFALVTPRMLYFNPLMPLQTPATLSFPLPAVDVKGDTVLLVPARDRPTVLALFPLAMIERRKEFLALLDSLHRYPPESVAVVVLLAPGIALPEAARTGQDTVLLYFYDAFGVIPRLGDPRRPTMVVVDTTGQVRQRLVVR